MKSVSSLWYGRPLGHIEINCIKSFLKKGYIFKLYIYDFFLYKDSIPDGVLVSNASSILSSDKIYLFADTICSFSDYWRYNLIYKTGEIWTDMDILLIKDLPDIDYIISSEFTNKSGAFKSIADFVPNIGVIKMPIGDPFMKELILICENKTVTCNISNMVHFRKLVKKYNYESHVANPKDYCPVGWQHATHLYITPYHTLESKYGVDPPNIFDIIFNSYTVHLWNNIYNKKKITKNNILENSLYNLILYKIGL